MVESLTSVITPRRARNLAESVFDYVIEQIESAALNFFDLLIIAGQYQYKPAFPFSPGAEFAGRVESIGPGVTDVAVGDRVIGCSGWGAAREKIAIDACKLVKTLHCAECAEFVSAVPNVETSTRQTRNAMRSMAFSPCLLRGGDQRESSPTAILCAKVGAIH